MNENIILIGPPGVGKSTVGVLLAKALSMSFADTDIIIQSGEGKRLQGILDEQGDEAFRKIEERYILQLNLQSHVIATGGSVVYSEPGMEHLKRLGKVVFLNLRCETLLDRIENLDSRGVVIPKPQTFCDMYDHRLPLYEKYADFTVDCTDLSHEQVIGKIQLFLQNA